MSVYMTEEEQIEAIKKWWKKYNGIILTLVSIILLVVAVYRYWTWHQDTQKAQASTAYEHLMVALANKDNTVVRAYANQLIENHNHTVYADVAHLILAKLYMTKDKYEKAANELTIVASESAMPVLKQVAKLRLSRLLAMKKEYAKALAAVAVVDDKAYLSNINELKGDIYALQGNTKEAKSFYQLAMNDAIKNKIPNVFLEMKRSELE